MMRMHADEEDLLNQQNTYDPGGRRPRGEEPVEPAEGKTRVGRRARPGSTPADPRQQKMFDTIVKQALQALTTPSGARTLFLAAQQSGDAAQAIAQLAQKALEECSRPPVLRVSNSTPRPCRRLRSPSWR